MKLNQIIRGLTLLAAFSTTVAIHAQTSTVTAVTAVKPTITITSPSRIATVTNSYLTITGRTHDNVAVTNVVVELNGTNIPVAGLTNWDAFVGVNPNLPQPQLVLTIVDVNSNLPQPQVVSTNGSSSPGLTPGANIILAYAQNTQGQLSLTNKVTVFYNVTAKLSATVHGGHGSLSPNDNGKSLDVGRNYTMTALASPGFEFTNWTVLGTTNTTSTTKTRLTFQMVSNLQLIANLVDVEKPVVTITTSRSRTANAVFTVDGHAHDNLGVSNVLYQVGEGPWNLAGTTNGFTNWSAVVILDAGPTVINVYATDAVGNHSRTSSVTVVDEATGFAPESLAGTTVLEATAGQPVSLSFGRATFSYVGSPVTNFGVGNYTYTLTDSNTAQVAFNILAPPTTGAASYSVTFSFTNNGAGTYIDSRGATGTFTLSGAPSVAPASLNGVTLLGLDTGGYGSTNVLGDGTCVLTEPAGDFSGTYSLTQYSPGTALLVETFVETNNFVLLSFGASSNTFETISLIGGAFAAGDSGTFTMTGHAVTKGYKAPLSLANLVAAITMIKTGNSPKSFAVGLGEGSFAQFSANTNQDSGVGVYSYVRTGTNTGLFVNGYVAPPEEITNNGGSNVLVFTGPRSATFSDSDGHGTITFSSAPNTAPVSLVGKKLRAVAAGNPATVVMFNYETFSGTSSTNSFTGNYTFAPYAPEAAMVQLNYTGSKAGQVGYVELWFSSAAAGRYVSTGSSTKPQVGTFTLE